MKEYLYIIVFMDGHYAPVGNVPRRVAVTPMTLADPNDLLDDGWVPLRETPFGGQVLPSEENEGARAPACLIVLERERRTRPKRARAD